MTDQILVSSAWKSDLQVASLMACWHASSVKTNAKFICVMSRNQVFMKFEWVHIMCWNISLSPLDRVSVVQTASVCVWGVLKYWAILAVSIFKYRQSALINWFIEYWQQHFFSPVNSWIGAWPSLYFHLLWGGGGWLVETACIRLKFETKSTQSWIKDLPVVVEVLHKSP